MNKAILLTTLLLLIACSSDLKNQLTHERKARAELVAKYSALNVSRFEFSTTYSINKSSLRQIFIAKTSVYNIYREGNKLILVCPLIVEDSTENDGEITNVFASLDISEQTAESMSLDNFYVIAFHCSEATTIREYNFITKVSGELLSYVSLGKKVEDKEDE